MGIILCQFCEQVIEYVNHEKVSTMYATCQQCDHKERINTEDD